MNINYELMKNEHIDGIMTVEHDCFAVPWHRQSFADELKNNLAYYIVALDGIKVVGYGGMWKICGEGHITNIAVSPGYRRFGIGEAILKRVLDEARFSGIGYLTLEVRKSNTAARYLYEKLGFNICGERKKYYENIEDAILYSYRDYEHNENFNTF